MKNLDAADFEISNSKLASMQDYSRMKAQGMTGFTDDSIETGMIGDGKQKLATPLSYRKTSMFPDISAVE